MIYFVPLNGPYSTASLYILLSSVGTLELKKKINHLSSLCVIVFTQGGFSSVSPTGYSRDLSSLFWGCIFSGLLCVISLLKRFAKFHH